MLRQGNYKEAEQLYRNTLILRTELLGAQHPDTLYSQHGVANALLLQGNHKEAELLHRQTLEARTDILGAYHPNTLHSQHGLANAMFHQAQSDRGRAAISTEHSRYVPKCSVPSILTHSIASMASRPRCYVRATISEAEQLYRETFILRTKVIGTQHPNTVKSQHGLSQMRYYIKKILKRAQQVNKSTQISIRTCFAFLILLFAYLFTYHFIP